MVRNSGATAVAESVGDHGCEYITGGVVLILGSIGRNFAAGMSGGRAFVLDINPDLVNPELVDILAVPKEEREPLREILSQFHSETDSEIAAELLENWQLAQHRFSMVMPRDYSRVLATMARALREGVPADTYVMEALHG